MIYHLFEYLKTLGVDFPGQGLLGFLTFRAIMASVTALLVAIVWGKKWIGRLQKAQIGEEIRDLGLEGQLAKKGTPTMGGIIIIISILCGVILFANLTNIYVILLIVSLLWLGGLGFWDDYIKVFKHNKEGMSEKGKLIGQIALGLVIALTVCFNSDIVVREAAAESVAPAKTTESVAPAKTAQTKAGTSHRAYSSASSSKLYKGEDVIKSTKTTIPFVKDNEFDYAWLSPFKGTWGWYAKWAIYMIMIVIVITAVSNGVNLTDGLDGLATGTSLIPGIVLGIFAWLSGNIINADYLNIMYIPGTGEVAVFMAAFVGALTGFLWYNSYPAQVFLGDTGSLAIGGVIGVCAVLIRKELLLPVLCGIFLVEALSVMMQRSYFKITKKKYGAGRRIFKMSPLHHHFQKENIPALIQSPKHGIPEAKIVIRFWIVSIILAVITVSLLKVR